MDHDPISFGSLEGANPTFAACLSIWHLITRSIKIIFGGNSPLGWQQWKWQEGHFSYFATPLATTSMIERRTGRSDCLKLAGGQDGCRRTTRFRDWPNSFPFGPGRRRSGEENNSKDDDYYDSEEWWSITLVCLVIMIHWTRGGCVISGFILQEIHSPGVSIEETFLILWDSYKNSVSCTCFV